jgi:hypothetical protein
MAAVVAPTGSGLEVYPLVVTIPSGRPQRRWSALARPLLAVPALAFSLALNVGAALAVWAVAAVRGRVPRWLYDFQLTVLRWHLRSGAYLLLLTDLAPRVEGDHPVACQLPPPARVARRKVLVWKLITAVPQLLVLVVMTVVLVPAAVVGWVVAAISGRLPQPIHTYAAGVLAWWARLAAYILSLTDNFPPYSLRTAARPARRATYAMSAAIGLVPAIGIAAFATFIIGFSGTHVGLDVPYQALRTGGLAPGEATAQVESGRMTLMAVTDPADGNLTLFAPAPSHRFVAFDISIHNWRGAGQEVPVTTSAFELTSSDGPGRRPILVAVDDMPGAGAVGSGRTGTATIVFEIPAQSQPNQLSWDVIDYIAIPRRGETIDWNLT